MTEKDLNQYIFICKEINILNKELVEIKSKQLIKKQGFTEKLYLGPIIEKTAGELEEELTKIERSINDKLHELYSQRVNIENFLNSIEDCEIRLILRLKYVNGMTYTDIASELTVVNEYGEVLRSITGDGLSAKVVRFFKNSHS